MQSAGLLLEGKYEIVAKIREGGMGTIYQVRHRLLDEIRVVKVMRSSAAAEPEMKRRFLEEARTAIRLKHPNICSIYDFAADDDGSTYLVMEYIDGISLADLLKSGSPPPVALSLQIAHQALHALGYLHRRGIVHRDVSPDNLMLTYDEDHQPVVKLIDLGIAKIVDRDLDLTATGVFLGKPRYASPEQFGLLPRGGRLDGRSDLYGLGVVLYELLTGVRPYAGKSPLEFMRAQHLHLLIPFEESDPTGRVAPSLRAMVLKALEKERDDRFATAEEFDEELTRIVTQSSGWAERGAIPSLLSVARDAQPMASDSPTPSAQNRLDQHFGSQPTPAPSAPLLTVVPQPPDADDGLHTIRVPQEQPPKPSSGRPSGTGAAPILEKTVVGPYLPMESTPAALPRIVEPEQSLNPVKTIIESSAAAASWPPFEVSSARQSLHLQTIERRNRSPLLVIFLALAAAVGLLVWRPWSPAEHRGSDLAPPAPAPSQPPSAPIKETFPIVEVAPPAGSEQHAATESAPVAPAAGTSGPAAKTPQSVEARQLASAARKEADAVRGPDFAPTTYQRAVAKQTAGSELEARGGSDAEVKALYDEATALFSRAAEISRTQEHPSFYVEGSAPKAAPAAKPTPLFSKPTPLFVAEDPLDPAAAAEARKQIVQVVGDYAWARHTRNTKLFDQVFPSEAASFRQDLARFAKQDVRLDVQTIDVQPSKATASVNETVISTTSNGTPSQRDGVVVFELAKRGGRWFIVARR